MAFEPLEAESLVQKALELFVSQLELAPLELVQEQVHLLTLQPLKEAKVQTLLNKLQALSAQ